MPTTRGEQARRMPFDSPITTPTQTQTPISTFKAQTKQEMKNKVASSTTKEPPLLNVITNFSPSKSSITSSQDLSLQQRRKQHKKLATIPKHISTLSPSDGTLMIGFSVQPEIGNAHQSGLNVRHSIAPEIVVTPAANLQDPWQTYGRHRPRSSVYSQITRVGGVEAGQRPPIPPIPSYTPGEIQPISANSWQTDFTKDSDERGEICRRYSGESQLGILRNASIHTNRRKSEGWWNTLVSPIFGRSNTLRRPNGSVKETGKQPNYDFLKVDPMADKEKRISRSSIWTDLSQLDAQRQTLAFFNDSPTAVRNAEMDEKTIQPETPQQEGGFGLASEYYEATWHDAYSKEPFYKCHGHDCSQKVTYRHGEVIGGPDEESSNALTEKNLAAMLIDSDKKAHSEASSHIIQSRNLPVLTGGSDLGQDSQQTTIVPEQDFARAYEAQPKISSNSVLPTPSEAQIFVSHGRTLTPDTINSRDMQSITRSVNASPAKAIRVLGIEKRAVTPEAKLSTLRGMPDRPTNMAPARKETSLIVPTAPLQDPFIDAPFCASPEAMTPGLQKDFAQHRAIPMEPPKSQSMLREMNSQTTATHHDPLNISIPRKAPAPPQVLVSENPFADPVRGLSPAPATKFESPSKPVQTRVEPGPADRSLGYQNRPAPRRDQFVDVNLAPPPSHPAATGKDISEKKKEKKEKSNRRCCAMICCVKRKEDKPRKKWYIIIFGALLAIIILILALVLTLTLRRSDTPIQNSWLNITGFPPIPTGISTIAQPENAVEVNKCVAPNTLWSCALPKEQHASIAPNAPDQPNFRLEIRFQNGSSVLNSSNVIKTRSVYNAASAGQFIRSKLLYARDAFTSSLFTPSPPPPSQDDQKFLGQTTDNNTAPFAGEATPFFISFLPTTTASNAKRSVSLEPRQNDKSNPFPNITNEIPPPSTNPDGTAAAANLLPFPSAQPLLLYNRGRVDEHYGFYTYFDRSILLKSTDLLNSTGPDIPDNSDGGAERSAADVRCTWAQTRFLVRIWTNAGNALQLLGTGSSSSSTAQGSGSSNNSATNFVRPGSFPYPISITLDRHGGQNKAKMLYCYGMDITGRIIASQKQIHLENRAFGGPGLINPGGAVFGGGGGNQGNGVTGGIDGGFGGCSCEWRNWK